MDLICYGTSTLTYRPTKQSNYLKNIFNVIERWGGFRILGDCRFSLILNVSPPPNVVTENCKYGKVANSSWTKLLLKCLLYIVEQVKNVLCCFYISTRTNNTTLQRQYLQHTRICCKEQGMKLEWECNTMHQRTCNPIASLDLQSRAKLSLTICIARK